MRDGSGLRANTKREWRMVSGGVLSLKYFKRTNLVPEVGAPVIGRVFPSHLRHMQTRREQSNDWRRGKYGFFEFRETNFRD